MHVVTGVLKLVITNSADLERQFLSAVSLMLLQDVSSHWIERLYDRQLLAYLEAAHVKVVQRLQTRASYLRTQ